MQVKARIFLGCVLAVLRALVCAGTVQAQQAFMLDEVIIQAGKAVEEKLKPGSNLAVLNFTSASDVFSDYVIEELTGVLVMNGKLSVIERRSLDLVRKEMNVQLSGDVSDDSAMSIGKQLGAQAIVSGSVQNMGSVYRFRIKVINVETARIEAQVSYNLKNDEQVAFLLSGNQGNAPPVVSAPGTPGTAQTAGKPSTPAPVPPAGKVYQIGDTGPAGGLIFYDKGNNSDGWRYLEMASKDAGKGQWGMYGQSIPGLGTAVGRGKRNTDTIITNLRYAEESDRAAQLARQYSQGGYTDWFLPSKDELNLIYTNLVQKLYQDLAIGLRLKALGGLTTDYYWSSSEDSNFGAWFQRISGGSQANIYYNKNLTYSVHAIRAF